MTEAELLVIEERAAAATPGPWVVGESSGTVILPGHDTRGGGHYIVSESDDGPMLSDEDAAFIAASRSDVPALISEVRRLKRCILHVWQRTDSTTEQEMAARQALGAEFVDD